MRLILKLYYLVFHTTLAVLYQLAVLLIHPKQKGRVGDEAAVEENEVGMDKIANDDVVEALDMEIEVLRNYRAELLMQANRTSTSATQSAKLRKQAAAVYTRMMKLNEQVLKRRAKEEN